MLKETVSDRGRTSLSLFWMCHAFYADNMAFWICIQVIKWGVSTPLISQGACFFSTLCSNVWAPEDKYVLFKSLVASFPTSDYLASKTDKERSAGGRVSSYQGTLTGDLGNWMELFKKCSLKLQNESDIVDEFWSVSYYYVDYGSQIHPPLTIP